MKLNKTCNQCGGDDWLTSENKEKYYEICKMCQDIVSYPKKELSSKLINEFVCENCGGKNGRLKEGKKLITIQCSSCKYTNIVFEKHTSNIGVQSGQNRPKYTPKCPICRSPNIHKITAYKRVIHGLAIGFLSKTARSQWECKDCGNKW